MPILLENPLNRSIDRGNGMESEIYRKRLEYAREKKLSDVERRHLWQRVIEVYEHLLSCKKSHSNMVKGERCKLLGMTC